MAAIDRKQRERQRKQAAGLVRLELWASPQHHAAIKAFAQSLAGSTTADPVAGAAPDPVAVSVDPVAGSTPPDPVAGKAPLAGKADPVAVNTTGG